MSDGTPVLQFLCTPVSDPTERFAPARRERTKAAGNSTEAAARSCDPTVGLSCRAQRVGSPNLGGGGGKGSDLDDWHGAR